MLTDLIGDLRVAVKSKGEKQEEIMGYWKDYERKWEDILKATN